MEKKYSLTVSISFLLTLLIMLAINTLKTPDEFSVTERRKLTQFPEISAKTLFGGEFAEGFDNYAVDQIAMRETFRSIKAIFTMNIFRKSDNNGIFISDNMVFKTDYPVNEKSVLRLCAIINNINEELLGGTNSVCYTVVPDKNYYLESSKYLAYDYNEFLTLVKSSISEDIKYIDIFNSLSLQDYFRTDSHWRQESLIDVAAVLTEGMSAEFTPKPYTGKSFNGFYGVFYGQSALNISPDELIWLVNETTENATVTSVEAPGKVFKVYDETQLESVDPYNIFMCGSAAIVKAVNPLCDTNRELIIFRDSYGSSLSPLLLESYKTITLIDLRYVSSEKLTQFVEFEGSDVLFIYSTTLFNTSDSIRG